MGRAISTKLQRPVFHSREKERVACQAYPVPRVCAQSAKLTGAFIISVDKAYTHLVNGTMSPPPREDEAPAEEKGRRKATNRTKKRNTRGIVRIDRRIQRPRRRRRRWGDNRTRSRFRNVSSELGIPVNAREKKEERRKGGRNLPCGFV